MQTALAPEFKGPADGEAVEAIVRRPLMKRLMRTALKNKVLTSPVEVR